MADFFFSRPSCRALRSLSAEAGSAHLAFARSDLRLRSSSLLDEIRAAAVIFAAYSWSDQRSLFLLDRFSACFALTSGRLAAAALASFRFFKKSGLFNRAFVPASCLALASSESLPSFLAALISFLRSSVREAQTNFRCIETNARRSGVQLAFMAAT